MEWFLIELIPPPFSPAPSFSGDSASLGVCVFSIGIDHHSNSLAYWSSYGPISVSYLSFYWSTALQRQVQNNHSVVIQVACSLSLSLSLSLSYIFSYSSIYLFVVIFWFSAIFRGIDDFSHALHLFFFTWIRGREGLRHLHTHLHNCSSLAVCIGILFRFTYHYVNPSHPSQSHTFFLLINFNSIQFNKKIISI